jgi:hypothetical protein
MTDQETTGNLEAQTFNQQVMGSIPIALTK